MAFGDVIARLSVNLGLETAAFDKGAKQASGSVGKLQAGLTKFAAAAGGAFAASNIVDGVKAFQDASRQALDAVGGLGEAAAAVGVTTGALQEFRYAATQVGLSTEQMDNILGQFSKRLGEGLLTGKGKFVSGLQEIGLSLDQLKGKSTTDQIGLIADAIQQVGSEAEKSALLTQFFGKAGQAAATLLADGSAGIRQYAEDARKLGIVASEAQIAQADAAADQIAALDRVTEAQRNLVLTTPENIKTTLEFAKGMAELKTAAMGAFAALIRGASENDAMFKRWRQGVVGALTAFSDAINGAMKRANLFFAGMIRLGRDMIAGLVRGIKEKASAVFEALGGIVNGAISRAKNLLGIRSPSRVFMEIGDFIGKGLAIGIEGGAARVGTATRKLTEAARQAAEETRELFARLFPDLEKLNNYRTDLQRIEASGFSDDAKGEARFRLGREFNGDRGDVPISSEFRDAADSPLFNVDLEQVHRDILGIAEATGKVSQGWGDLKQVGADAFGELSHQLKGVLLGAQSLGDAVKNLIARLADMALSMAFKALGTSIGIPGFANGTNFAPGGLALVGERGPELVNLRRGSQVIPNHELANIGRSGGQPVTFNLYGVTSERGGREAASQIAMRMRHSLNAR